VAHGLSWNQVMQWLDRGASQREGIQGTGQKYDFEPVPGTDLHRRSGVPVSCH
jgi:hypothetical protein